MPKFKVELKTYLNVTIEVDAEDEETAGDAAWSRAEAYCTALPGDGLPGLYAEASFDGTGAETVSEVSA